MNIRNLASKESVGVKFKDGIDAKFCLKPWIQIQDGFESDFPKIKFQTITS